MPKKIMSPEERKAWGAEMKAAREAKKVTERIVNHPPREDSDDIDALKKRISELEAYLKPPSEPTVNQGRMTGVYERYKLGAENYPDPRERLALEPKLGLKNFNNWFELEFRVEKSRYPTPGGGPGDWTEEPKFILQLIRIMEDPDTGEKTNKRYGVNQLIFHEDPGTALSIANDVNFDVTSVGEADFLNEMRYLRMRDWLLSCFYPEPAAPKSNKKEMVVGNKLVEVWEVNSETPERIDFGALKHKL